MSFYLGRYNTNANYYKLYKLGKTDSIRNYVFNQDLLYVDDIPEKVIQDYENIEGNKGDYILDIVKNCEYGPGQYCIIRFRYSSCDINPIKDYKYMIYYHIDDDTNEKHAFIDCVEMDKAQRIMAYFNPTTIDDKIRFLRKLLNNKEIDEFNYKDYITQAEEELEKKTTLLNKFFINA